MILLVTLLWHAAAAEPIAQTDRAAFDVAAAGAGIGLGVEVEVTRGGRTATVPLSSPIYDGDLVALRFTPSEAGYAYVVNEGTSGRWTLLFPAQPGDDNRVSPGRPVRYPPASGFEVSGPTGDEGVYVALSPTPIAGDIASWVASMVAPPGGAPGKPAPLEGLAFRTLRDLSPAPVTYVVADAGEPELRVAFSLRHAAGTAPALP